MYITNSDLYLEYELVTIKNSVKTNQIIQFEIAKGSKLEKMPKGSYELSQFPVNYDKDNELHRKVFQLGIEISEEHITEIKDTNPVIKPLVAFKTKL